MNLKDFRLSERLSVGVPGVAGLRFSSGSRQQHGVFARFVSMFGHVAVGVEDACRINVETLPRADFSEVAEPQCRTSDHLNHDHCTTFGG